MSTDAAPPFALPCFEEAGEGEATILVDDDDDDDDVFAFNAEDVTRGRGVGGGVVHVDFPVSPSLHFLPRRAEAADMCQP